MIFSVWWICFRCWSLIFFFLPEMISSWLLSESWSRHHTDSSTFQQIKAVHCVSRHTSFLKMTNWKAWIKIYSLQETFFYLSPTGKMGGGGGLQYSLLRLSRLLSWWFVKLISFSNIYAMNIFTSITWF